MKKGLLVALLLVLFIAGCKKDKGDDQLKFRIDEKAGCKCVIYMVGDSITAIPSMECMSRAYVQAMIVMEQERKKVKK